MPFKIYQFFCSHVSITHGALVPTVVSRLHRRMSVSPNFGWRLPTHVFQSPHIRDRECVGMAPMMSSIACLATSSSMPCVFRFVTGGR